MKVCFVSLYAYSLFDPSTSFDFGGSEVRVWRLATGLARLPGIEVSCVVLDHGQPRVRELQGVSVRAHPRYRCRQSLRKAASRFGGGAWSFLVGLRKLLRRAQWKARLLADRDGAARRVLAGDPGAALYSEIDADVYCVVGVTNLAAEVASFCAERGKAFVLLLGSDHDLSPRYRPGSAYISRYGDVSHLCHYAVSRADTITAQTEGQASLLAELFGRNCHVLPNPVELSIPQQVEGEGDSAASPGGRNVLWIGKSDGVKRPDKVLALARRHPSIRFVMVMNPSQPDFHAEILAARPANVEIIEHLPFARAEALFASALALLNTSAFEGFPNTFLQAGKYGVPLLSLEVDPDGIIGRHGCGFVAGGDMDSLSRGLEVLVSGGAEAAAMSEAIRRYVRERHDLEAVLARFRVILEDALSRVRARGTDQCGIRPEADQ